MTNKPFIHPATPPKLVKKFHKHASFHKTADEIGVNVRYVYELITYGIEPTDRTATGREIRARLHLRRHKPKNQPKQKPAPKHLIWWNNIGKEMRHTIIARLYQIKEHYK